MTFLFSLAAFMITREEFYDLSGVEDARVNFQVLQSDCCLFSDYIPFVQLTNPLNYEPPFRFGTVINTHTEATILKHYREMYQHMKNYNLNEIRAGIDAVKRGYKKETDGNRA